MGYFAAERDEAHVDNTLADYPESQRLKLRRESTARPRANPSRPEVAGGVGGEEAEQEGSKLILQCLDRYSLAVVVGLMSREETRWMKGENLEDEEGDKSRVDCRTPPPASTKSVRISIRPRPFDPYANASSKDTVFARLPGTSLEQQFHPTVIVIPSSTGRDTSRQDHDLTPSTSDASTPPRETSHRPSPAVMSSSPLETIHAPYTTVSRPSDPLNPLLFPAAAFPRPTHYLVLQLSPASFHTPCPTTFVNLSGELSLSESTIPRTHVSGQDYAQPPELVLEKRSPMDEAMDVYMDATATDSNIASGKKGAEKEEGPGDEGEDEEEIEDEIQVEGLGGSIKRRISSRMRCGQSGKKQRVKDDGVGVTGHSQKEEATGMELMETREQPESAERQSAIHGDNTVDERFVSTSSSFLTKDMLETHDWASTSLGPVRTTV